MSSHIRPLAILVLLLGTSVTRADQICDHTVVLDDSGKLQPWTSYDYIVRTTENYIKNCPTRATVWGNDPWYMITAKFGSNNTFISKQNDQGSQFYYGAEAFTKYYAYSGDMAALQPILLKADRLTYYLTPATAAWPNCPITQDNTPDGQYTDTSSETDKMANVGRGYIDLYKFTGEQKYLDLAVGIADTLVQHVQPGDATHSPLPWRVRPANGTVVAAYTSDMVAPVRLLGDLIDLGSTGGGTYQTARNTIWNWVMNYPMKNYVWANYDEDMSNDMSNMTQTPAMETAKYILEHPEMDPNYKTNIPALLSWVKGRFGQTVRYGATSIREQDSFSPEITNHTQRYADVNAKWFGALHDDGNPLAAAAAREEARASMALSTYVAYNQYSTNENAINYTGIGYLASCWFTNAYFESMNLYLDAMKDMPELAPSDSDHILGSTSVVQNVSYKTRNISYTTFDLSGQEILRITFAPTAILANGQPLDTSQWTFGDYRGVPNVLIVNRAGASNIEILGVPEPGSLMLLGSAAATWLLWRFRRRASVSASRYRRTARSWPTISRSWR